MTSCPTRSCDTHGTPTGQPPPCRAASRRGTHGTLRLVERIMRDASDRCEWEMLAVGWRPHGQASRWMNTRPTMTGSAIAHSSRQPPIERNEPVSPLHTAIICRMPAMPHTFSCIRTCHGCSRVQPTAQIRSAGGITRVPSPVARLLACLSLICLVPCSIPEGGSNRCRQGQNAAQTQQR